MKKLDIKLSSLDKNKPDDVVVHFRLQQGNGKRPPTVLFDTTDIELARARSAQLTQAGEKHDYMTYWTKGGRHVKKWPTMMAGKRRYFRVSLPYKVGASDAVMVEWIEGGIRRSVIEAEGTESSLLRHGEIKVNIDAERNRNAAKEPVLWCVYDGVAVLTIGTEEECLQWGLGAKIEASQAGHNPPAAHQYQVRPLVFGD